MKIGRISPLTGKTNYLEIDVTSEQIEDWKDGTLIQNAMPNVSKELREFLISGYTPDDWKQMIPEFEDEDDYPLHPEELDYNN